MVAAACGGGGSKKSTAANNTTTTVAESTTSTTAGTTETTAASVTSSTAGATSTTAAAKTATTVNRGKTSATTTKAAPINASIINVTTTSSTAPRTDIQPGGTMVKLATTDFNNLDPAFTTASTLDGAPTFAVFDTLMYDDRFANIVPQTAESMTSSDGIVWTLKLRPNIKFSDGTPYDAASIKFNWDRIADPNLVSNQATSVKNIAKSEVVDATTLRVTLINKDAQFPRTVVNIGFIGSPTAIQKQGKDDFGQNPVGAGPFLFKSWVHQSVMQLVRNPNYWNAPRPYLDAITIKYIVDEQQRLNSFAAGEGNQIQVTSPESADQVVKAGGHGIGEILSGGPLLHFAMDKAPLNDIRVRELFYRGIDLKQLASTLHGNLLGPLDSIFQPASPLYDKNQLQPGYDPARAQQLINAWSADNGGKKLEFTILVFNLQYYRDMAQFVAGSLNKLNNINVTLDVQSTQAVITKVLGGRNYQVATFANLFNDPDPKWGNSFVSTANPNPTGWKNTQYDADIADAKATLDPDKRKADFRDALKQFYTDFPTMYVDHSTYYLYGSPALQDIDMSGNGMDLLDRMWLKTHS